MSGYDHDAIRKAQSESEMASGCLAWIVVTILVAFAAGFGLAMVVR